MPLTLQAVVVLIQQCMRSAPSQRPSALEMLRRLREAG